MYRRSDQINQIRSVWDIDLADQWVLAISTRLPWDRPEAVLAEAIPWAFHLER